MASLGTVAARGARVVMTAQMARLIIQLGSLVIMSRLLTPQQVGLVAMVIAVINVADLIRDFGLSSGAIQAKTLSRGERDNLFWVNLSLGLACMLVAAAIAPLLALLYSEPKVTLITLVLSLSFLLSGATTQYRAGLTRDMRFRQIAAVDVGAQVIATGTGITLAFNGFGYWAIVAQQLTMVVCALIGNVIFGAWVPRPPRRDVDTKKFFRFGGPILGTNLLGYALNNVDNIGLGAVAGPSAVGVYSRAYQLLMVPLGVLNGPMSGVAFPVLAKVQNDEERFVLFVRRLHLISAYFFGLGFGVMAGLAWPIVDLLLGDQWSAAAPIVAVLALGGIFKALTMVFYQVYVARGATAELFKLYLRTRPVMLLLILGGLPWGPIGVATGHLVAAVWFWAYSLRRVARLTALPVGAVTAESIRAVVLVSLPVALTAHLATTLVGNPWVQLLAGSGAVLVWCTLILLIRPVRRDLLDVWSAAKMAFSR